MTKAQQNKIFRAMNEEQKSRVADFMAAGLNKNTAISSVVMQDMVASKNPASLVVYAN
jgi:hypothetical protein